MSMVELNLQGEKVLFIMARNLNQLSLCAKSTKRDSKWESSIDCYRYNLE